MTEPDFEQIARQLIRLIEGEYVPVDDLDREAVAKEEAIVAQRLRQVWNAGFEVGGQHETFVKHLKDENNAAHQALDSHDAPKTTQVPSHHLEGGWQPVTLGLAARINAVVEQWKANSRENKSIAEGLVRERNSAAR